MEDTYSYYSTNQKATVEHSVENDPCIMIIAFKK